MYMVHVHDCIYACVCIYKNVHVHMYIYIHVERFIPSG